MKLTTPEERAARAMCGGWVPHMNYGIAGEIRAALKELVEAAAQSDFGSYELGCLKQFVNAVLPEEEKIK